MEIMIAFARPVIEGYPKLDGGIGLAHELALINAQKLMKGTDGRHGLPPDSRAAS